MKKILLVFAFVGVFLCGRAQGEYYIQGFYQRHGEGKYTLTDLHTQGITIDGKTDFPGEVFSGNKVQLQNCRNGLDATMIKFSFEKVKINCKSWKDLRFQYWDEDNNKWKDDVEACMGESKGYSQKDIVMMLVLDYSSSMDNSDTLNKYKRNRISNISLMKNMAIDFINSISRMSSGNVHVGIIAFAGMDRANNQVFPITPLTESNSSQFEAFIRNSSMGTETALFYSMDNAIKMIENYVSKQHFTPSNFNGTCMITFTDGLDNASINDDISPSMHRGSKNEYLAYLDGQLRGPSCKKILGMPLEPFAVGFTGSEDFTEDDLKLFKNVLQRTTQDENHFKLATRFEEVEDYFKYIIDQLTERWQTLNVYVGEAQHGKVRWVLECGEAAPPPPRPEKDFMRLPLLGLNVGVGGGLSRPTKFLDFSVGFDFAVGIKPKFAMGAFCSYKTTFQTIHQLSFGLDFMIGPQKKAFLLGLGCNTRFYRLLYFDEYFNPPGNWFDVERHSYNEWDFDLRLGGVLGAFYFFADFSIGPYVVYDEIGSSENNSYLCTLPQLSLNLGINFMQLGKKNKE